MGLRVANGPVSWGVDVPNKVGVPPWEEVYTEMGQAGYRWCELGPMGYLPADDTVVRDGLRARGLSVAGSHLYEPIHDRSRRDEVVEMTRRTCARIKGLGGTYLVIIDVVNDERGATAGRYDAARRLTGQAYLDMVDGMQTVAGIAADHGLVPVLHPHAGTFVEFEDEIEQMLADTASDGMQLCIDTGHQAYAGIDPVALFVTHREHTPYLHLKDVNPVVLARVRKEKISFFDAIPAGVFCPLGQGMVDFTALAAELAKGFNGPGTVEQDRDVNAATTALQDARASLDYLKTLGLAN